MRMTEWHDDTKGGLHTANLLVDAVLLREDLHGGLDNTTAVKGVSADIGVGGGWDGEWLA